MNKTFRNFLDVPKSEQYTSEILTGIHEAGNPYYDWFFGGHDVARKILDRWMTRISSEVSINRVKLLLEGHQHAGGFIALTGKDLLTCRKSDMLALLKEMAPDLKFDLSGRFAAARALFPRVATDTYYLSKIWVTPDYRGKGLSRGILQEFLLSGRAEGLKLFQVDVFSENKTAIRLYQSFGFETTHKSSFTEANLEYLSMILEEKKR